MDRDLLLIEEMIDSAEQAAALVAGVTVAELAADRVRGDALLRNLTVLGEAAAQVSQPTKMRFAGVPWRQPARLRNRIVHGYWSIDLQIAHTTADQQLPAFAAQQRAVLAAVQDDDGDAADAGLGPDPR